MIHRMRLSRSIRHFGDQIEAGIEDALHGSSRGRSWLYGIGWVSAGVTALAVGVVVGREIRQRYRFYHRTPYDFYAHAGDQEQDIDFGVGI
jgi:hypothetical protein